MKTSKKHFKKPTKDSSLRAKERKNVNKEIKTLLGYGHTVQLVHRGANSVIKCNGVNLVDYDGIETQFNFHIWRQVNEAIYKSMDDHPVTRYQALNPYSNKKEVKIGDEIAYVDIKHCYLQVANKLGYIADIDYKRILRKYADIKIQVCAAITSLFREVKSDYYNKKGRVERTIICENNFLDDIQNNIINYSRKIMFDYCHSGMDYYYRNVDGIVVPLADRDFIKGYMEGIDLEYKIVEGRYIGNGMIFNKKKNTLEDCIQF